MIASRKCFRTYLCAGVILCAVPILAAGVALGGTPTPRGGTPALLLHAGLSGPQIVPLSDAVLARTTGVGIVPPEVPIPIPTRGRVTLWDELNVKPSDLGAAAGQISITINNH